MIKIKKQEALDYHANGRPGKIETIPTKPYSSQRDLSLAYSPGVAEPCLEIAANPENVYKYTSKGNLVAVISNGTAVLGLGNIGAEASKPVMEGKALLFKIFADIDVFDIEIATTNVEEFIKTVKNIAPTFGGINLEDIKAPEAFEIEQRLKKELDIPVMHDDQHGTAIISGAGLINAVELSKKNIADIKVVISGAGASAITCAKLYVSLGVNKQNIVMVDSVGVIKPSRGNLPEEKLLFANEVKANTLQEALVNADMFLGLSRGNIVSKEMLKTMNREPIIFALANPNPEISYKDAVEARPDAIIATGRSDYPNQVNNVLGFPFIFRGALDVRATSINEEMKLAAVKAIADLAKEPVPEEVNIAYHTKNFEFGKSYFIPKPLDFRLITAVAPAVAKAAMDSGVARKPITDWAKYREELSLRMGLDDKLVKSIMHKAKQDPKRVVFAEADNYKILKAAQIVHDEGIAKPILLGKKEKIDAIIQQYNLGLKDVPIIDPRLPSSEKDRQNFGKFLYEKRQRKGLTLTEAISAMRERNYFGTAMVKLGLADAFISGLTRNYPDALIPALHTIGKEEKNNLIAGMYILITKKGPLFLADTTINFEPTAEDLVEITRLTAEAVERFKIKPRIALLSYSNFGSSKGVEAQKVSKAVEILHQKHPKIVVDGEIQANFALNRGLLQEIFPFTILAKTGVNTLIFPNLAAGNIAYKLIQEMGATDAISPILLGMKNPEHVLQLGSTVREIVNMTAVAVVDAQTRS